MYNCLRCAFDSFKSFADDMLSGLSQNLNSYILWDQILLDQVQMPVHSFADISETGYGLSSFAELPLYVYYL